MHLPLSATEPAAPHPQLAPSVSLSKSNIEKPAFEANRGIGDTIRLACDLTLTFGTGKQIHFGAGRGVRLCHVDNWRGGDDIVIAVEKDWGTSNHYLAAMMRAEAELAGLEGLILGGFHLDPTGAVLADSFWDIADRDADAAREGNFERMVSLFITNQMRGYPTDLDDLKAADLGDPLTLALCPKARREADRRLADRDLADDAVAYDREGRVERLANILIGYLKPNGEGWDVARRAGYPSRELGDIWPDVVARVSTLTTPLNAECH